MVFSGGLHHIVQRGDVSIETAAHILQVKEQNVDVLQLLGSRFFVLAVKRNHRQTCKRILAGGDGRARLRLSAETVFRTEQFHQVDLTGKQRIHQVCISDHRGLVAAQGYALPFQKRQVAFHALGTSAQCGDRIHRGRPRRRVCRLALRTRGCKQCQNYYYQNRLFHNRLSFHHHLSG